MILDGFDRMQSTLHGHHKCLKWGDSLSTVHRHLQQEHVMCWFLFSTCTVHLASNPSPKTLQKLWICWSLDSSASTRWYLQYRTKVSEFQEDNNPWFEGLDEGSRSFADYLKTSDHLRRARTIEKGTRSFLCTFAGFRVKCPSPGYVPISGIWEKVGQAHTIEKLWGFAYKPLKKSKVLIK